MRPSVDSRDIRKEIARRIIEEFYTEPCYGHYNRCNDCGQVSPDGDFWLDLVGHVALWHYEKFTQAMEKHRQQLCSIQGD